MAEIVGELRTQPFGGFWPESIPALSKDLWETRGLFFAERLAAAHLTDRVQGGAVISQLPIEANGREIDGELRHSFFSDYYFRVHVVPNRINVGNLLVDMSDDVYVWNAYPQPKNLALIDEYRTDGIFLEGDTVPPSIFPAYGERHYLLTATQSGPAKIEAVFTFVFDGANNPTLEIIGSRVVTWLLKPLSEPTERLSWKTDIIQAHDREQRIAIREAPRQSFDYRFFLTAREYSALTVKLYKWAHQLHAIPAWLEGATVGSISEGALEIPFDTRYADYREGGMAIILDADMSYEVVDIVSVADDKLTILREFPRAMKNVTVYPLRFSHALDGFRFTRGDVESGAFVAATFSIDDNVDLSASGSHTQYRGRDVIETPTISAGGISERIARSIDVFDNGAARPAIDTITGYPTYLRTVTFLARTRKEMWSLRQFLHSIRGRQGTFWLPSWNNDFSLSATYTTGSNTMIVSSVEWFKYRDHGDIVIDLKDGTRLFVHVTGATEAEGGDVLTLETPIAREILIEDVRHMMFLYHVRFDADELIIDHKGPRSRYAMISAQVREVPE
mgnify:CR=1 FL=1